MAQSAMKTIEQFNDAELQAFFECNGMNGCSTIFNYEKFDGMTFLNIKKGDVSRWKKLVPRKELEELVRFSINVKQNPEKYLPTGRSKTGKISKPQPSQVEPQDRKNLMKQLTEKLSAHDDDKKTNSECAAKTSSDAINKNTNKSLKVKPDNTAEKPVTPKQERPFHNQNSVDRKCAVHESRFYMNVTREEADTVLRTAAKNGAYLFRPSTKYHCALSVFFENNVHHFGIAADEENKLEFKFSEGVRFDSIEHMVKYFKKHSTIKTMSTKQEIQLTVPVIIQ